MSGGGEVRKSTAHGVHKALQLINLFISEPEAPPHMPRGMRMEYLGLYAACVPFKASVNGKNIVEKIKCLEDICLKTKAIFSSTFL